jgi:flagellar biosynthesis protein FlhB
MADHGQKTEKPTQQRLQKARREGQFPISRDFISSLQYLSFVVLAIALFNQTTAGTERLFRTLLDSATSTANLGNIEVHQIYRRLIFPYFLNLTLWGLALLAAIVLVQLMTTRFGIAGKQLAPDIKRLNPISRIQQMPKDNAVSFIRSIILMVVIFFIVYKLIEQQMGDLTNLAAVNLSGGLRNAAILLKNLVEKLAMVLVLFGIIDFVWQRSKFQKNMRMSKQEIKEELKDVEGNMQMKQRIRRVQRETARRNMIKAVEKASVVIVNPTHYAIAVHYQMGTRTVPVVVAKGKNYLARIIRERALKYEVPIVENKPLAQALYQAVDVGNEIPPALYRAVAEVLGQIYRILNRQ